MKKHTFLFHCDFLFLHLSKLANSIKFTGTPLRAKNRRIMKVRNDAKVKNNKRENQQNLSKEHHSED